MNIEAYILRYNVTDFAFAELFLSSSDFDLDTLKKIAAQTGMYVLTFRQCRARFSIF